MPMRVGDPVASHEQLLDTVTSDLPKCLQLLQG
jgi:hypothetical protein